MNNIRTVILCFAALLLTTSFASLGAEPSPFGGVPGSIPGVIEAENFDEGGEGVAYHDADAGNNGGFYRQTDVDIDQDRADGAFYVGWIQHGEQLNYTVQVNADGYYFVTARVASLCSSYPIRAVGEIGQSRTRTTTLFETSPRST